MGEPKLEQKFTYADYLTWANDDERWELIDGIPYNMSPAPKRKHQGVEGNLFAMLYNSSKGKPCKVYVAPFDVVLTDKDTQNKNIDTVVQPDISVICDKDKLTDAGCKGSPDFIIEILSEATAKKDATIKKDLYEKNGVKEYWLVDTWTESIRVYLLENKKYSLAKCYEGKMDIEVQSLKGLKMNLKNVFND